MVEKTVTKRFLSHRIGTFIGDLSGSATGKMIIIGIIMILFFLFLAIFAPVISPYSPIHRVGKAFLAPNLRFWFGTDNLGRDILSRVIYGTRIALAISFLSVIMASVIGIPLGLIAGYVGKLFDRITTMVMDSIYAFPGLILAIAIAAMLGPGVINISIAITVVYVPTYYRVVRNQVTSLKNELFVEGARSIGAKNRTILSRYIFPSTFPSVVVIMAMNLADAIMTEAGLSFLGLGIPPPTPDWGYDLNNGQRFLLQNDWWMVLFPGIAIILVVLGFSLVGEGLNEYLNPNIGERR
ncbi:MAG: ABC transporter permease [Thermotogae bacterium]|nr:ABC transporter permease [Thermotogota bacterium]